MTKKWTWFFSVLLLSSVSWAEVQYLKLARGKVIAYEHVVKNPAAPTLILLPGVNRSLNMEDRSVRLLSEQGWNLLMPSLTAHPLSIQGLEKNEYPYFLMDSSVRAKEFAADIDALVTELHVSKAIPVTLSYSSSVGAYLNQTMFPHIIETVPLGTALEGNPEAAKAAAAWESWLRLNPFLGPFWIRQTRDAAYSANWGKVVDANLKEDPEFYGKNPRVSDIKAGYVAIARAVEDFDFSKWNFAEDRRTRDFVIAEKENDERLQNQIQVIQNYIANGKPVRVVVVANAGHVLPSDRPGMYAGVIGLLAAQPRQTKVQFAFVESVEKLSTLSWQGQNALENWINKNTAPQMH